MSLSERLQRITEASSDKVPEAAQEVMKRATEDLRQSGILDGVVAPGDPLPRFQLEDSAGAVVDSAHLLAEGPLVINFFRGHW